MHDHHQHQARANPASGASPGASGTSGASGAHPSGLGTGVGVGVIVAGAAGSGNARGHADDPAAAASAETVDASRERDFWRENFGGRDYVEPGSSFDDYGPAYDFGVQAQGQHPGRAFDDAEYEMSSQWETRRGSSSLSWELARPAARDAWTRIESKPGSA